MRYRYTAAMPSGKMTEGEIDAGNPAQVLEWMAGQGYKPVSVKAMATENKKGIKIFGQKITLADKVFLTKYLALMLKVGTDLFRAIDILISDFDKPILKSFLIEIRESLSQGKPFYVTFAKYPQYFSSVIVNLIKAGEKSGNLESVFGNVSDNLEKDQELQNRVKAALIYPIILVGVATLVLILMVVFVLPRIANVFSQTGIKPPLFSRIVFAVGLFFGQFSYIVIPFLIALIIFLWYFFFKNKIGRQIRERTMAKLPIVKNIVQQLAIQRFASTFASLLRAGLPIIEALEITAGAVGSEELKEALLRIAKEGIAKGLTVGEAFRRETYFPRVVTNLIAISEKAGHMEEVLETLSNFYASEVDASVKILVSFLEPVLLLSLGAVIGLIALAVIVPIYQLVSTI
ncbi:MAG: type II secretion system F family protein [Parcubacteria group bacterium]